MLADGCLYSLLGERFQYFTGKGQLRVYADSHKSNSWKLEKPVNAIVKKWIHLKDSCLEKKE